MLILFLLLILLLLDLKSSICVHVYTDLVEIVSE